MVFPQFVSVEVEDFQFCFFALLRVRLLIKKQDEISQIDFMTWMLFLRSKNF